jgi:Bacterial Ig domain
MRLKPASVTVAVVIALTLALSSAAVAASGSSNGKPGGGGGKTCTRKAPAVVVDNTWAWASPGSYGLPGQQLTYAIHVVNYDAGCGSSSFLVTVSAPSGFSVSFPTNTISLRSGSSGYLWAHVTSPSAIANGDYPLTVTVQRAGSTDTASTTSWYKVYSSDSVDPTLYWPSPADGATITGRSWNVAVSANDDHAVEHIDLYLDGALKSTTTCQNIAFECQLFYTLSLSGLRGQSHTATFKAYDRRGNVGVLTSTFTVS